MAGLVMETVEPDSDYESSEAEPEAETPAHQLVLQAEGSVDENQDTANVSSTAVPASKAGPAQHCESVRAASMPKRKRRRTGGIQEGTYIGGGCRMMCYCPKHSHVTQRKPHAHLTPSLTDSAAALQNAEASIKQPKQAIAQLPDGYPEASDSQVAAVIGQQKATQVPQHQAGCIRNVPFNHACRRGQREPDAIAAALAKRTFVSKTPYLIVSAQQHSRSAMPATQLHASEQALLQQQQQSSRGQDMGVGHSCVKTQTERFKEMQQSVGRRLTCGKSAIHGLGAFAKLPHQAGKLLWCAMNLQLDA